MEAFGSKYTNDLRVQLEAYGGRPPLPPSGVYDFRGYSTSYASSAHAGDGHGGYDSREVKVEKKKATTRSNKKGWAFGDPEFQRKKRVAGYRFYAVEGRMKGSIKRSFRWLKERYTEVVYGWR